MCVYKDAVRLSKSLAATQGSKDLYRCQMYSRLPTTQKQSNEYHVYSSLLLHIKATVLRASYTCLFVSL